jgi:ribosomal-protein-alanine N-acetyltransferase
MQAADLDAVVALAATATEAPQWPQSAYTTYLAPDPGSPSLLRIARIAIAPHSPGEILAFACATLLRVPNAAATENLCQLDSMAVRPDARRRGIGAALLRALLAWAAHNGARHFSLEVRASNAPAIALYQRFGLQPEGRRPRYYAHPQEDALLLGIPVTAGTP